jgi:hypothetical protein
MASRFLFAPLVAATLVLAAPAGAEPTAADKETARGLMTEGRADRDKGDLKGALKAFAGADSIMHVPTTGLELARAQVAVGQLVEARDTALRVMRIPESAGDPAPFKQAREAASQLNDQLGGRIPSLTVNVKNVPDGVTATVTIDDAPLSAEVLGQPRKLDPGHHVVVAKAGTADGKQEVDLAEKESKQVTIELPAQSAAPPASVEPTGTATEGPPPDETPPASERSGASKAMIWGGFGLAGAGVIAGSITGLLAMSQTSSVKSSSQCSGTVCNPSADGDISSAKTMATISTVSFIAGGVGAVVGVIGLLTVASSSPAAAPAEAPASDANSARLVPWLGFGAAGVSGRF